MEDFYNVKKTKQCNAFKKNRLQNHQFVSL